MTDAISPRPPRALPPWPTLAAAACIAIAIGAAWAPSLGQGPAFDDIPLMANNRCFADGAQLARTVRFAADDTCAYRPVRYWTFWLDQRLFGETFRAHKIGNVAWHTATAWLVLALTSLLLIRTGRGPRTALALGTATALLWALHPAQTDAVTYVSGRRDVLVGFFTLLTLYAALRAEDGARRWWALAVVAMVLAMLSKEVGVAAPALWIAWRFVRGQLRDDLRRPALRAAIATGVLAALGLFLWRGILRPYGAGGFLWGDNVLTHSLTALTLQTRALGVALGTSPLIGDYFPATIPLIRTAADPRPWIALALVLGLVGGAIALRRRLPIVAFGILAWFIGYAPSAQIVPHHEIFAEHYLYLPLFGLVLAAVALAHAGVSAAARRIPHPAAPAAGAALLAGVVIAGCAVQTQRILTRNPVWGDALLFYSTVLEHAPDNHRARAQVGLNLAQRGQHHDAIPKLRASLDLWRQVPELDLHLLRQTARTARQVEDRDTLVAVARRLLRRHPEVPTGYQLATELALEVNDFAVAEDWASQWRTHAPDSLQARTSHAIALVELDRHDEAWSALAEQEFEALPSWAASLRCSLARRQRIPDPACPQAQPPPPGPPTTP